VTANLASAETGVVVPTTGAPTSFADLVDNVRPAVVNIFTTQIRRTGRRQYNPWAHDPWGVPETRVQRSLGSGFIIDDAGNILTNTHVIADATEIQVQTFDDRELEAQVVGIDSATDLAVIRIFPFEGMQTLPLGDSDQTRVGDWLVAVGNPFGLASTVTAGILSARGRRDVPLGGDVRYVDFLQTDVSINPGNSGGPLVNMQGEAIGINTAVSRAGQGIGFAIPSNMATELIPALLERGRVSRSWIGLFIGEVNAEARERLGLSNGKGALIREVVPGGPAHVAGLSPGEVILALDGRALADGEELAWLASTSGVGQTITLTVAGPEGVHDVQVTLGELPE
jgi:serine protease Do